MKGTLIIVMLIAMLITGYLVIKNNRVQATVTVYLWEA